VAKDCAWKKDGCLDMNAVQEGKTRKARKETNIAVDMVDFIPNL
jgi:hypothetical protein